MTFVVILELSRANVSLHFHLVRKHNQYKKSNSHKVLELHDA